MLLAVALIVVIVFATSASASTRTVKYPPCTKRALAARQALPDAPDPDLEVAWRRGSHRVRPGARSARARPLSGP